MTLFQFDTTHNIFIFILIALNWYHMLLFMSMTRQEQLVWCQY